MIDLDKLRNVRTIITHDNCPDGIATAILLHDVLPAAEVRFMQYNTDALKNLQPSAGMLFCDFTPDLPTKLAMVDGVEKKVPDYEKVQPFVDAGAIVLDHHKDKEQLCAMFGANGVFAHEKREPGVSGAVLAYREVWKPMMDCLQESTGPEGHGDAYSQNRYKYESVCTAAETFAKIAGVRDTWQKHDPLWRRACIQTEVLRFYPQEDWLAIKDPFGFDKQALWYERYNLGEILLKKHEKSVGRVLEKSYRFTSDKGTRVIMFEGVKMSSDAAEAVDKEADIILGFDYMNEDGKTKLILSSRSHAGYDVSKLARHYGGGGHTAAAGFSRLIDVTVDTNPYGHVISLVNEYEKTLPIPEPAS